jgi:hypothetical protein
VSPEKCKGLYCPDFAIHGYRTDKAAAGEKESDDAC